MIEFKDITKTFGNFFANKNISFQVQSGTCHGIVGENGAGKSTLMNILCGFFPPDSGQIIFKDRAVSFSSPKESIELGIGMVHQHFKLVSHLTVWENIILGSEPNLFFLRPKKIVSKLESLQKQFGFSLDLSSPISNLTLGQKQQVEILKLLYRQANVLVLDEPTALLTPQESSFLFSQLEQLRKQGKTLLLITHKLTEVLSHTQFVSVLRKGEHIDTHPTSEHTVESLSRAMMGHDRQPVLRTKFEVGPTAFQVNLNGSLLSIQEKEIVGIAGMEGQGQEELVHSVLSQQASQFGSLYQARQSGFGFIPTDRQEEGLVMSFSTGTNLVFGHHREKVYQTRFQLVPSFYYQQVGPLLSKFHIEPPNVSLPIRNLSGGNQQKVILARETHRPIRFLLASQPTRGVDLGAIDYIHAQFLRMVEDGASILLISSDLDELLALSDRIAVIRDKRFSIVKPRAEFSVEELGLWMSGAKQ